MMKTELESSLKRINLFKDFIELESKRRNEMGISLSKVDFEGMGKPAEYVLTSNDKCVQAEIQKDTIVLSFSKGTILEHKSYLDRNIVVTFYNKKIQIGKYQEDYMNCTVYAIDDKFNRKEIKAIFFEILPVPKFEKYIEYFLFYYDKKRFKLPKFSLKLLAMGIYR